MINLETDPMTLRDWFPLFVEVLITIAAIFGSAGFWQWKQAKDQAKRDAESKKNGVENKVDNLTTEMSNLTTKVDTIATDLSQIKSDVEVLQKANKATVEYRQLRDKRDREALKVQEAVIVSLKGLLRERLLDNYKKCMEKGYYSEAERETYGEMFKCYESDPFDGNGIMHQLQPKILALPWTEEETKKSKEKQKI